MIYIHRPQPKRDVPKKRERARLCREARFGTMIPQGTRVRVRTSNGGDATTTLLDNYRRTYDAVIAVPNGYAIIPASRLTSVEVVS